jgi:CubicO group peptidase (beta-lactamase class C family)
MSKPWKLWLPACATVLFFSATGLSVEPTDPRVLDAVFLDSLKAWNVPGAAVAIVRDDKVIYLKGVGVRQLGGKEPVTPDTLFAIGSCTKAFTTTLMAMLVDEGKMTWDDPVRKHLDWFHLRDPIADSGVTLCDLVTHRTGVGSNDLLWYCSPLSQEQLMRRLALLEPAYPFRSGFQYQTTMFTTAGHAVAAAAGEKWSNLVQKRLFDPLGMKNATLTTADALATEDHATPHRFTARGTVEPAEWYECKTADPAGSISASARELSQWLRFQLNLGAIGDKRLVSAKALVETHTPQNVIRLEGISRSIHPETNLMSYGMGWVIQDYLGERLVSHAGLIDGFRVQITLVPQKKLGIVVLTNLHDARMTTAVCYSFLDILLGLKHRNWDDYLLHVGKQEAETLAVQRKQREEKRQRNSDPPLPLRQYVGTYEDEAYGKMEITLERGELQWRWNRFTSAMKHFQENTFTVEPGPIAEFELQFIVSGAEVTALKVLDPIGREFRKIVRKR